MLERVAYSIHKIASTNRLVQIIHFITFGYAQPNAINMANTKLSNGISLIIYTACGKDCDDIIVVDHEIISICSKTTCARHMTLCIHFTVACIKKLTIYHKFKMPRACHVRAKLLEAVTFMHH